MTPRHAICLVVDGLRASALGTYGNTSFPTPRLDALASSALVADWLWADSPHLDDFYCSAWQGVHALRPNTNGKRKLLLDHLRQSDVRQWLVTDDPWLTEQAGKLSFDEALLFETGAETAAEHLEETALGRFFSETVERLHQWREDVGNSSSMAWLHCRGLYGPWDAPPELREDLLEDEDPTAATFIDPPTALREIEDPDILLTYRVAYAAQIAVLDACVFAFVEAIKEKFADNETLFMLIGSRGFALGEHGAIGTGCAELYNERLHLPWLLYPCGNTTPLPRLDSLSQPADIGATLLDWLGAGGTEFPTDGISYLPALSGGVCQPRQLAVATGEDGERAVRTPAWMMRQSDTTELFTKPDDRWESNDVADLCTEVEGGLQRELAEFERCCREGEPLPVAPQDSEFIVPFR